MLESWEEYAEALRWGSVSGAFPDPGSWWWELRPHPRLGTLEFRVPDSQATPADAGAIAAVIHALAVWLDERPGEAEGFSTWRIEENRWSACRYGVDGAMADLRTGECRSTGACLEDLITDLAPTAERLGAGSAFEHAGRMVAVNGAVTQRRIVSRDGAEAVARWLADGFLGQPGG